MHPSLDEARQPISSMSPRSQGTVLQVPTSEMATLRFGDAGMVILNAGSKSFRVPSCILTAQSTKIRKYIPHPNLDEMEVHKYHGSSSCLSITLDDPEDDVEHFLRAVYDSGYFEPPPTVASLGQILGILSLSAKYDVPFLHKRALKHLESGYPTSLEAYQSRKALATFPTGKEYDQPYSDSSDPLGDITTTLSVLSVAHSANASWILPSAYYECCLYSIKEILTHPQYQKLDVCLRDSIMIGYTNQLSATYHVAGFLFESSADQCKTRSKCLEVRRSYAEAAGWINNCTNPLGIWEPLDWEIHLAECCNYCITKAKESHAEAMEALWERLPDLYGLPAWEILLAERQREMI